MSRQTRHHWWSVSNRRRHSSRKHSVGTYLRRSLRFEPLEDRRMLAVVTVDTLDDSVNLGDGHTSLREAIFATNIVPGADTIIFAPALTAGGPATILLTQGELAITDALTISGPGANLLTIDASGNDPTPDSTFDDGDPSNDGDGSRIFNVDDHTGSTIIVEISGLTLTGGDIKITPGGGLDDILHGAGGAIFSRENLIVSNSTISGNNAGVGGGIMLFGGGKLTVTDSMITDNWGGTSGGGIYNVGGGGDTTPSIVAVTRCTISGNVAGVGGGISQFGGSYLTVIDSTIGGNLAGLGGGIAGQLNVSTVKGSTISGNTANESGGGIWGHGNVTVIDSTIGGNSAKMFGGGVFNDSSVVSILHSTVTDNEAPDTQGSGVASRSSNFTRTEVHSSIVAGNVHSDLDFVDGSTNSFQSSGYNLIGAGNAIGEFVEMGDQTGVSNPLLSPLADNGGPTFTHALMPHSPALDAGDPMAVAGIGDVPEFDQRGAPFTRVYDVDGVGGPRIDIGAYEAQPYTLVVDTLADEEGRNFIGDDLTLREAIEFANTHAGHDIIEFAPALTAGGPATILLNGGELAIIDAVTINGPGAGLLTIDASGNDHTPDINNGDGTRIFNVDDQVASNLIDVQIGGLTLTGGDSSNFGGAIFSREALSAHDLRTTGNAAAGGGAIALFGTSATVSDCLITGNAASSDGGAIFVQPGNIVGTIVIARNTIADNTAARGGAISVVAASPNSTLLISDNTISGNSATLKGGAVFLLGTSTPKTTIRSSTISGNTAVQQGGALYASGARDLSIVNSLITDNSSTSPTQSLARGGALYFNASDVAITGSTISGNTAATGGGVYSRNGDLAVNFTAIQENLATNGNGGGILSATDRLSVTGSTISGNMASGNGTNGRGGGLWVAQSSMGPDTILDTVLANNSATQYGGGAYVRPDLRYLNNSPPLVLTNVTISGNTSNRGGGIATGLGTQGATGGALLFNGGSISGNTSVKDGGAIYSRCASLTVNGTTISGNHAGSSGGGIATPQSGVQTLQMSFVGAVITGNSAGPAGDGGGLWIPTGTSTITLISTNVSGNSATRGGGIFRGQSIVGGSLTAIDSTISGNMAIQSGGGVYDQGGMLTFTRSSISGNTATLGTSAGGGGIFARQADVSLVDSSLFGNSTTNGRGGGAYINNGDFIATGTTIAANAARQDGGGLFTQVSFTDRITFQSSTVSGNSSLQGTGGLVLRGPATIRNSTITGNAAASGSGAGGIFAVSGPFELDHTIVAKNTQVSNGAPDLRISDVQIVTVRFSLIGDNSGSLLVEAPLGSPDINGNLIGKPVSKGGSGVIDAKLGALTNNGGPTLTNALLPGSPAIDAGAIISGPPLGYDQRGVPFSRAVDGNADAVVRIDIGAYESQGVPSFSPGDYNQNGVVDAADYTKWRDTLHREGTPFSGADGNGSGRVDQADYELWKSHLGQVLVITPPPTGGASSSQVAGALSGISADSIRSTTLAVTNLQAVSRGPIQASGVAPATVDRALLAWLAAQSGSSQPPPPALNRPVIKGATANDASATEAAVDAAFDRLGDDLIAA